MYVEPKLEWQDWSRWSKHAKEDIYQIGRYPLCYKDVVSVLSIDIKQTVSRNLLSYLSEKLCNQLETSKSPSASHFSVSYEAFIVRQFFFYQFHPQSHECAKRPLNSILWEPPSSVGNDLKKQFIFMRTTAKIRRKDKIKH